MRYLTDPVEIRAFRKKQSKKILRMVWRKIRAAMINLTICTACLAIWSASIVVLCIVLGWVLQNCTIVW